MQTGSEDIGIWPKRSVWGESESESPLRFREFELDVCLATPVCLRLRMIFAVNLQSICEKTFVSPCEVRDSENLRCTMDMCSVLRVLNKCPVKPIGN